MPAPKGLTKQLPLRMTDDERQLIETVQEVYGRHGVQMSLNDTVRHLVRRGAIVLACTVDGAEAAVRDHRESCADCAGRTGDDFGCPDGVYLHRNYLRVLRAHAGTTAPDEL
ncbi:hypothetical protein ACIPQA_33690 [Streptomyces sp. NPDC090109]|uniref:hypothetical protein n=1 Tax=Streptomyces sp. NPDC090109 TaxID=3365948 RepID=UPI003808E681